MDKKNKGNVIYTMNDFQKLYYPKKTENRILKNIDDSRKTGTELARRSLKKIK